MLTFEAFSRQRNCEDFMHKITNATEGYADFSQIGVIDEHQIIKIVINPKGKRTVAFIAGIHGDEEGGPAGVLKFLEEHPYIPKTKKVVIIPLANPTGYIKNTRENKDGIDLNRKFSGDDMPTECKFILDGLQNEDLTVLHTLHEDPSMNSFYLYYTHNKLLAEELKNLAKKYFEICNKNEIHEDKMINGLIPLPHVKRNTIEDVMLTSSIPYITTETPGKVSLAKRANYTKEAMKLVINYL